MKTLLSKLFNLAGLKLLRINDPRVTAPNIVNNFINIEGGYNLLFAKFLDTVPLPENSARTSILMRLLGTPPTEAYYILSALNRTKNIEGDVCELGVAQGETSALIANEIREGKKRLHLFDSFEGLPSPTEKDQLKDDIYNLGSMSAYTGEMSCPETMVRTRLQAIKFPESRYVVNKGFVEKDFEDKGILPDLVSFAYIDFDFYEPILIALKALHPRLPSDSVVVVDDYDFFSTGAKTAVDEFINEHPEYILHVPDKTFGHFCVITKK